MGDSGAGARAKRATKSFVSASQSAARAGKGAARASASVAQRSHPQGAQDHPRVRRWPHRSRAADRALGGREHRRWLRGGRAGGHAVLQHLGRAGPRPGRACPDHHDGAVCPARTVHRADARPGTARAQVHPDRHGARARAAVLGHGRGGAAQRLADLAAGRVRRAAAAEGLRRHQGLGHARDCCLQRSRWSRPTPGARLPR